MMEIKIGGRDVPLYYSTYELIEIQEAIGCTGFQLKDDVFGVKIDDEDDPINSVRLEVVSDPVKTKRLGTLIRIMGNAGLEEKGEKADLTDKWVLRHMKPTMIMAYALVAMAVINEGNKIEVPASDEEDGPVDEGLAEELSKKAPGE